MEIYAGMVENLDANIGRVIQYLKRNNLYDNTLIFFVSDNGAEGFIRGNYGAESGFDNSVNNVGTSSSYHYVGPRWAEVSAAPFHLWKDTAGEGATTAPAIVKLPTKAKLKPRIMVLPQSWMCSQPCSTTQILPSHKVNTKAVKSIRQVATHGNRYSKIKLKPFAQSTLALPMNYMAVNMPVKGTGKLHYKALLN
jgi:hypothetical protein